MSDAEIDAWRKNPKMLEELGLNTLASEIITSLPQPA
jgi:hypothetical protein